MAYAALPIKTMVMAETIGAGAGGGTNESALGMMAGLVLIGMASNASAEALTFTNGFEGIGPYRPYLWALVAANQSRHPRSTRTRPVKAALRI
jgi:hypothetical protein